MSDLSTLTIVALKLLVQHSARSLVRAVRDPYRSDLALEGAMQIVPQRLVGLLGQAICVRGNDGHRARRGIEVIKRPVFLNSQIQNRLLVFDGMRVFADVLAGNDMLDNGEERDGHGTVVTRQVVDDYRVRVNVKEDEVAYLEVMFERHTESR